MRIGAKKRPFYRVVAVDERKKRTGGYLELLGTYNPLTQPKEIKLNQQKIDEWLKKGAQPSLGFLRITGKAPQRPPRKPKKEKKAETPAQPPTTDELPTQKTEEQVKEAAAERAKVDEDSQVSEVGEVRPESTSSDVHEDDRASSEPPTSGEEAELENQVQPSEPSKEPKNKT